MQIFHSKKQHLVKQHLELHTSIRNLNHRPARAHPDPGRALGNHLLHSLHRDEETSGDQSAILVQQVYSRTLPQRRHISQLYMEQG